MAKKGMRYIGDGTWSTGIPARDLSQEEVKGYGHDKLIASGLYEDYYTKPKAEKPEDIQEVEEWQE